MRIVGGRLRGRALAAPAGNATRPTSDRAREALFNILEHGGYGAGGRTVVGDAVVIDAFAGTGALGLEALSRGAAVAVLVENDKAAIAAIRRNIAALGVEAAARIFVADATALPPRPRDLAPSTLVFVDPPYDAGLASQALAQLARRDWLAASALCIVEHAAAEAIAISPHFDMLGRRRYGKAGITFLRYRAAMVF